ncbi:hypothetical protein AX14_007652 [Amanita brunnescens Koide BX004]|nr:hypothetical protein AX14_007652 [Amanita brunnescens Koide BX004]
MGTELVATASDDKTVKGWDAGEDGGKISVAMFEAGAPATAVRWGADGIKLYVDPLDNEIRVYDTRENAQVCTLIVHGRDTAHVACSFAHWIVPPFSLSVIANYHSDVRPFSPSPRHI